MQASMNVVNAMVPLANAGVLMCSAIVNCQALVLHPGKHLPTVTPLLLLLLCHALDHGLKIIVNAYVHTCKY